jgi:hypothetical protein
MGPLTRERHTYKNVIDGFCKNKEEAMSKAYTTSLKHVCTFEKLHSIRKITYHTSQLPTEDEIQENSANKCTMEWWKIK